MCLRMHSCKASRASESLVSQRAAVARDVVRRGRGIVVNMLVIVMSFFVGGHGGANSVSYCEFHEKTHIAQE